jgi:hypothetical protein
VIRGEATHTEERTHYDSGSDDYYGTYTTREVVKTGRGSRDLKYSSCVDTSKELTPFVHCFHIIKVSLSNYWVAGNEETRAAFKKQREDLEKENKDQDEHYSLVEEFTVGGFRYNVVMAVDKGSFPRMLCPKWYVIFTLLMLSYPYRLWMDRVTVRTRYNLEKTLTK